MSPQISYSKGNQRKHNCSRDFQAHFFVELVSAYCF